MKGLKVQIRLTIVFAVIALITTGIAHISLTDIYHGELDVSLEWNMVRLCAFVWLLFIGMTFFTLARTLRVLKN